MTRLEQLTEIESSAQTPIIYSIIGCCSGYKTDCNSEILEAVWKYT